MMAGVPPTVFASTDPLPPEALSAAGPPHYPRRERLGEPLELPSAKASKAAEAIGLTNVGTLLEWLPRDRREARTVAALVPGESATVAVEVRSISSRPVRRRGMRPLVEAVVGDATGVMKATFFNQPWLATKYPAGTRLVLHGKYKARNAFTVESHATTTEGVGADEGDVAHYPATDGLSSTQILELVRRHRAAMADVLDPLPGRLRAALRLPDRHAALDAAHFGDAEGGRRRLAFDELLLLQLALLRRRARRREALRAEPLPDPRSLTEQWLETLPFTPTADQVAALEAIDADLAQPRPMQRLLMGEVGSGKTVVALHAMLRAVEHGGQAALMAPTETLAEQHFATLQRLGPLVSAALLTGATPAARRADLLGKLASGELKLLVGTHALIEEPVVFDRLLVAVVDEQHRFGVNQRRALDRKAGSGDGLLAPHVLHMTATPIPRTLALTAYGDLDVTVLRELPAGRRPITTHVANTVPERARAYERIREELRAGRQAFVVCPLVEESEALQAKSAIAEYERLASTELRDFRLVLMHGRMSSREKQAAMESFAGGGADVLVSTTVIEVGIDVANASVMLVENAERFGISQLHQLRGRIGRGPHDSLCLLFGPKEAPRLRALASETDGFALAEVDLELRGEGELIGVRQSGMAAFRFAILPADRELLELARRLAQGVVESDPQLVEPEHALLADALEAAFGAEALEPIPA